SNLPQISLNMNITFLRKNFIVLLSAGLILSSCVTKKEIVYFQNAKNFETVVDTDTFKTTLKLGDIISIYVSTLDPTVTQPYNLVAQTGIGGQMIDYLIDVEGNIDYPVLGKIK